VPSHEFLVACGRRPPPPHPRPPTRFGDAAADAAPVEVALVRRAPRNPSASCTMVRTATAPLMLKSPVVSRRRARSVGCAPAVADRCADKAPAH